MIEPHPAILAARDRSSSAAASESRQAVRLGRRRTLQLLAGAVVAAISPRIAAAGVPLQDAGPSEQEGFPPAPFKWPISLAQWSLHRALFSGRLDPLDFPRVCRERFGLGGAEFVNTFYREKLGDDGYFRELRRRGEDAGVASLLIMIDGEGDLGDPSEARRLESVERHLRWAERARELGCHSIRVNARSAGSPSEQARLVADGLRRLSERVAPMGLSAIVENHGGLSSDGAWLAGTIAAVGLPNCGTLPDFGNFRIDATRSFDRYEGVAMLMPFAKALSAKSHDFDEAGEETSTDFARMMQLARAASYRGHVGIEYEGGRLGEEEGIVATRRLLERAGCVAAAPLPA